MAATHANAIRYVGEKPYISSKCGSKGKLVALGEKPTCSKCRRIGAGKGERR